MIQYYFKLNRDRGPFTSGHGPSNLGNFLAVRLIGLEGAVENVVELDGIEHQIPLAKPACKLGLALLPHLSGEKWRRSGPSRMHPWKVFFDRSNPNARSYCNSSAWQQHLQFAIKMGQQGHIKGKRPINPHF